MPFLGLASLGFLWLPLRALASFVTKETRASEDMPEVLMPVALCAAMSTAVGWRFPGTQWPTAAVLVALSVVMLTGTLVYVYWVGQPQRSDVDGASASASPSPPSA
jgi:hypothetical protein